MDGSWLQSHEHKRSHQNSARGGGDLSCKKSVGEGEWWRAVSQFLGASKSPIKTGKGSKINSLPP